MEPYFVIGFYRFIHIDDREALQPKLLEKLKELDIKGSIYLAVEGFNAGLAGRKAQLIAFIDWLSRDTRFANLRIQWSESREQPFYRAKVRLKNEIVTFGIDDVDPNRAVGKYVEPEDWNSLIQDPDVVLIDTRNDYEFRLGHFKNAIDPQTDAFSEFPQFVHEHLDPERTPKVAMYCTGGIRCEKATSYLLERGFKDVFHLKGGILNYLESIEEKDSLWSGECFVFDQRTALGHQLETTDASICNACWRPVTAAERLSEHFVEGVSCPNCYATKTEDQRERYRERQQQIALAKTRGEKHMARVVQKKR